MKTAIGTVTAVMTVFGMTVLVTAAPVLESVTREAPQYQSALT